MNRLRVLVLMLEWQSGWVGPCAEPYHKHRSKPFVTVPVVQPNDLRRFLFHPEFWSQ
jgi:hypothetical protein